MKIESNIGKVPYPAERIYDFASDFRNFNKFIPEDKISNWSAEEDRCSFSMNMVGNMGLKIIEREAPKLIKIATDPEYSSQNFTLWMQFVPYAENECRIKITIEPHVNAFMLSVVKKPLKQFVDSLVEAIENLKI